MGSVQCIGNLYCNNITFCSTIMEEIGPTSVTAFYSPNLELLDVLEKVLIPIATLFAMICTVTE